MKRMLFVLVLAALLFASPAWSQKSQDEFQPGKTEFTAAVITEQNVTFAVVIVRPEVFGDKDFADSLIESLEPLFGEIPVVLMVQDAQGAPTYYGRTDISEFLANVPIESIPFNQYVLKQGP